MEFISSNKVKINLGCVTKDEVRDLKRRLAIELEKVRSLVKTLEKEGTFLAGDRHGPQLKGNEKTRVKRVNSEVGSVGPANSLPLNSREGLNVATVDNGGEFVQREKKSAKGNRKNSDREGLNVATVDNGGEFVQREKKSAKGNRKNSDSAAGKGKSEKSGKLKKVSSSVDNKKKPKSNGDTISFASSSQLYKSCNVVLGNLMKHKFSWVFNEPVDVKKLGLRDYFTIVRHPMDLGTVKNKLSKNWYKSAKEFAEDVRRTFNNAMLYNPKGQDVHYMAEQLLKMFDEKWKEIEEKFKLNRNVEVGNNVNLPTPTSRISTKPVPVPTLASPPPPRPVSETRTLERAESMTMPVDSNKLKSEGSALTGKSPPVPKKSKEKDVDNRAVSYDEKQRLSTSPQSLPSNKDLDKREMSYEEKQRLSTSLQTLPSDKLDNIVQIIKKKNPKLFQEEDDIEVDLDSVDSETLWELDRFVTAYKESLSKNKRKAEVTLQDTVEDDHNIYEENLVPVTAVGAQTVTEAAEKTNTANSPVRGDPPVGHKGGKSSGSSGSSSSDSGSSSSDSDSNSSSGSGSDAGH